MVYAIFQNRYKKILWILGSSTKYHMMYNYMYFLHIMCYTHFRVLITNEKLLHVIGIGIVNLPPIGHLYDVLHIPI